MFSKEEEKSLEKKKKNPYLPLSSFLKRIFWKWNPNENNENLEMHAIVSEQVLLGESLNTSIVLIGKNTSDGKETEDPDSELKLP